METCNATKIFSGHVSRKTQDIKGFRAMQLRKVTQEIVMIIMIADADL